MSKNLNKGKEKTLQEKVKQFFGIKGPSPVNFENLRTEPYALSSENLKDISPENSLNNRLKTLKELYHVVRTKRLEDNAVEALCNMTADMLGVNYLTETRHIVLQFYCCVIQGQLEKMNIMRSYFFNLIRNHKIVDDISPRLDLLKALSENGKSIKYFEEDIGPFLLELFPEVIKAGKAQELMVLLINIIKCHAAYLDDDVVAGFIELTCNLCRSTSSEEELQACLEIMNAVLCYSHLPLVVLRHFILTLCMTVNIEKFSQHSWKLMRNLLGTSMGHTSILTLCRILQDKKCFKMPNLLRGAVFFIGMALWGSNKVPSLMHPPTAVLPSLLKALDCEDSTVAYEIVLAVQRLIKKNGDQLQVLTWDVILDIIEKVLEYPDLQDTIQPTPVLATSLHDLITIVEESSMEESMHTCDRLFKIIDGCSGSRDDDSVNRLIMHTAKKIHPMMQDFLPNLNHLLEKYFRNENRQSVQLKVLQVLSCARCASVSGYLFEDDFQSPSIDQTILQYMSHLDAVLNVVIRKAAIELLIQIAESCITKRFFEILDIVEKVLKRPFDNHSKNKENLSDVEAAVLGLIQIFKKKLHMLPSSHCVRIYNTLLAHVKMHYQHPEYLEEGTGIRKMVIEFLLTLRANAKKQMGIFVNEKEEYSLYVRCSSRELIETTGVPTSPPPGSPTVLSSTSMSYICFTDAYQVLITCIKQEKDWRVLELTLKELPKLLQNKALIISGQCSITLLCSSLCSLVSDKSMDVLESLTNTPTRFTRTELHARVFPAIASLAAYHSELESYMQRILINGLQSGLVSRSAKICIEGLTLCTLEMRKMMFKLLPSVLLKLSQISATVGVAISVLEFLSNLIRLPELYISFVEDQYMSIFAIALPYTNPFKFNQYTVALAHHVIAMWFLKCRIPFRKEFAKFITKGLRSNLSVPFDESQALSKQNVDNNTPTDSNTGEFNANESQQSTNNAILSLHNELMEIGIDLMARFTFGMSSNVPKRSAVSEFLLDKGQRSSWLVGNKIVTITTSGCGTKAFKYGLCEKCYASCREMSKSTESEENEEVFPMKSEKVQIPQERRRHRSAIQRSDTTLSTEVASRSHTRDDILLHRHSLASDVPASFSANNSDLISSTEESTDDKSKKDKRQLCSCWCSSWAEIHIRRPTGNTSWMMKIQNRLFLPSSPPDFPLPAITSLLLPRDEQIAEDYIVNPSEYNSEAPFQENEFDSSNSEKNVSLCSTSEALACPKSHSPIRRTNSSPDMNSGWATSENLEISLQKHFPQQALSGEIMNPNVCTSTLIVGSKMELTEPRVANIQTSGDTISEMSGSSEMASSEHSQSSNFKAKNWQKVQGTKPSLKLELSLDSSTSTCSSHSPVLHPRDRGPFSAGVNLVKKEDFTSSVNSMRSRIHTISVMSPIHNKPFQSAQQKPTKDMHRSGMSPSFIFLQLYHNSFYGPSVQKPLFLHQTEVITRALRVLDRIPPYDTHKIGVVYVGPGQADNEFQILNNQYGSLRYVDFLRGLGTLIRLSGVDLQSTYVGGLDTNGEDGKYALVWHDDVMQVAFHVATLLPNKKSDVSRNCKKMHIANDFVNIVYNESGEDYNIFTITSQVTLASVIIRPEDFRSNVVTIKAKTEEVMEVFGHSDAYIVSDDSLPIFVRQLALHANLACLIISHQRSGQYPHVSNWLERLRKIKLLRTRVLEERSLNDDSLNAETQPSSNIFVDDFTDYV